MNPQVSIIIVTHNASFFLRKTLDSIKMQQGISTETIVVDNHSTDDTLAMLSSEYKWVKVVKRGTSEGFSAGNNLGLKHAYADTILFFNPDITFLEPDDLKRCYEKYYSLERVGIFTPRVNLVATGGIDETCHRGFPTPWAAFTHFSKLEKFFPGSSLFSRYNSSYLGYDDGHEIDSVGGMCMLLAREVGDKVGWWDEDYPFYGEDIDLCYRVKESGYYNYYWPGVVVLHYKGATTGMSKQSRRVTSADRDTTKRVKGWSIQAMETFYRKHYLDKYPPILTWLVFAGIRLLRLKRTGLDTINL